MGPCFRRDDDSVARSLHPFGGHTPPPGLAFGEPDDRLQRGIQYAAASRLITSVSGILDRPIKSGDDSWGCASDSIFKQPTPSLRANGSRECAPDEAKQSIEPQRRKEWIASSHPPSPEGGLRRTGVLPCANASRLSQAMTSRHSFAISRLDAPEVCQKFPYPPIRGRRECRAPDAPDSRVCNDSGRTHTR
jgi:hypothetical protein